LGEIGDGAALPGVQVLKERRARNGIHGTARCRAVAQRVASGRLQLDDVSTRVGKQLGAIATGNAGRKIDHPHP
jgi:hypothetical protein